MSERSERTNVTVPASSHGNGGVAFMAHVAGFIVGMIAVFAFKKRQPQMNWV